MTHDLRFDAETYGELGLPKSSVKSFLFETNCNDTIAADAVC
jgi:hypothetical protein